MIFTVDAKALKDALAIAGRVVPTKSPWPVAMYARLDADDTSIRVRGTNMEITFEATVAAEVEEQGVTLLPFATFAKFVSAAKSETVTIRLTDDGAKISAGRSRIGLKTLDPGDFPDLAPVTEDLHAIDTETLSRAFRFCAAAASDSEVQYHIKGVMVEEHGGNVDLWGTDGKVMNHACLIGISDIGGGGQIPQDAVQTVLAMGGKSDTIRFAISGRGWVAEVSGKRAWGKVIEDKFVDARGLIDRMGEVVHVASVASTDLLSALDVAICGADNANKARHIVMRADAASPLVLRGYRPGADLSEVGRSEIDVETSAPMGAAYSSDYLRDVFGGLGDGVAIGYVDSNDAQLLRASSDPQSAMLMMEGVVYPIRTSEAEVADV